MTGGSAPVEPRLLLAEAPPPGAREAVGALLDRHSDAAGVPTDHRPLSVLVSDPATGAVTGGLLGRTGWDWLFIELLAVPQAHRRTGLGTRLVRMAEQEAMRRGCRGAWLDTMSFQARPFYEKLGYRAFGQIDDCPPGHARIFLSRRFTGD